MWRRCQDCRERFEYFRGRVARVDGYPDVLVLDPGKELDGYITDMAQAHGITILLPDSERLVEWEDRARRWSMEDLLDMAGRRCTPAPQEEWLPLGHFSLKLEFDISGEQARVRHKPPTSWFIT